MLAGGTTCVHQTSPKVHPGSLTELQAPLRWSDWRHRRGRDVYVVSTAVGAFLVQKRSLHFRQKCSRKGVPRLCKPSQRGCPESLSTQQLFSICKLALPSLEESASCTFERIKAGNTNLLYKVAAPDASLLLRIFGENDALKLDRSAENVVYASLSEQGLAPSLRGTFENGRIEEWLDGRAASAAECRRPAVFVQVARQLARLHQFEPPVLLSTVNSEPIVEDTVLGEADEDEPWAWKTVRRWLPAARRAADILSGRCADGIQDARLQDAVDRLGRIDLESIAAQCGSLKDHMDARPWEQRLCFSHNDLSNTNVLWDEDRGVARLLDFEYSGMNYRGFDLATHFSHWAGGATDGLYEDGCFPSEAEQEAFAEAYLEEALAAGAAEDVGVGELLSEIENSTPLAHLVWGLWAVCMLPDALNNPEGSFSHIEYAERRLSAFRDALERIGVS